MSLYLWSCDPGNFITRCTLHLSLDLNFSTLTSTRMTTALNNRRRTFLTIPIHRATRVFPLRAPLAQTSRLIYLLYRIQRPKVTALYFKANEQTLNRSWPTLETTPLRRWVSVEHSRPRTAVHSVWQTDFRQKTIRRESADTIAAKVAEVAQEIAIQGMHQTGWREMRVPWAPVAYRRTAWGGWRQLQGERAQKTANQ